MKFLKSVLGWKLNNNCQVTKIRHICIALHCHSSSLHLSVSLELLDWIWRSCGHRFRLSCTVISYFKDNTRENSWERVNNIFWRRSDISWWIEVDFLFQLYDDAPFIYRIINELKKSAHAPKMLTQMPSISILKSNTLRARLYSNISCCLLPTVLLKFMVIWHNETKMRIVVKIMKADSIYINGKNEVWKTKIKICHKDE